MQAGARPEHQYVLGHSRHELNRLSAQSQIFEPFTHQFFLDAGLRPGMRVLDIGSGAGDVAFLAASLIGSGGSVLGVDRAPAAADAANQRARELGLDNVHFISGDPTEMGFDDAFDAVVGRLVLMYYPDPAAALRKLTQITRQGGLVAFQELDIRGAQSYSPAPLVAKCVEWIERMLKTGGSNPYMGSALYATFVAAGLPKPAVRLDHAIGAGPGHPIYSVLSDSVRTLLPQIEKLGLATAAEVDIDTLRNRIEAAVATGPGIVAMPALIGAWSRIE